MLNGLVPKTRSSLYARTIGPDMNLLIKASWLEMVKGGTLSTPNKDRNADTQKKVALRPLTSRSMSPRQVSSFLIAPVTALLGLPLTAQAGDLQPFTIRNPTPLTICKVLVGPNIVADTYAVWVKAFAEANNGNPSALEDPYEIASCKTPPIPNGYKGTYQQVWSFDVGAGIKPGKEETFNWQGKSTIGKGCKLDVIMTINSTDASGTTTSGLYMKNEDFCAGSPHLINPTSSNAKEVPTPN
jgi:hypothetical protein